MNSFIRKPLSILIFLLLGTLSFWFLFFYVKSNVSIAEPESSSSESDPANSQTPRSIEPPPLLRELGLRGLWLIPINSGFGEMFSVPVTGGLLVIPISESTSGWDELWPQPWDIIVKGNGEAVSDLEHLRLLTEQKPLLDLLIFRRGNYINLSVPVSGNDLSTNDLSAQRPRYREEQIHVVYYVQGEEAWDKSFNQLEEGEGTIAGKITIAGSPPQGMKVSILLQGDQRTQPATVGENGEFEVHLPPGTYSYVGYVLSGENLPGRELIPVDHNLKPMMMTRGEPPLRDSDRIMQRMSELSSKFGPEKAAQMIQEEFANEFLQGEHYSLDARRGQAAVIPPILYREPVRIIAPLDDSRVSLDQLQFAWTPYEGAASYIVEICRVDKSGITTTYYPAVEDEVEENALDAADVSFMEREAFPGENAFGGEFVPGHRYAVKVFAFDRDHKVLSASSEHGYNEFVIK